MPRRRVPDEHDDVRLDLASLAHDMRSPLCAIALLNDQLQALDAQTDPNAHDACHKGIAAQVQRLAELVATLEGHTGHAAMLMQCKGVNLQTLLENTLSLHAALHEPQGYAFALDIPKALPYVFADRTALGRVLDNLLDNAVKYSDPHRIVVRALAHHRQNGSFVVLEIQDQGPGIHPKHWKHLFEPFYRAGHEGPGTGLGLAIVRRIVDAHRGTIGVDCTPGGGTTFRVLLPAAAATNGISHTIPVNRHVYNRQ